MKNKIKNRKLIFLINIGLIFLFGFCLIRFVQADETSLSLKPSSESFQVGKVFPVKLIVDANGQSINAVHADIIFPADKLEVVDVSKENSIFSFWPEEPHISDSKISFSGGLPNPGFIGIGEVITVNFRAKKEGPVNLEIGEGKVLANDGLGTNILVFIKEAKYSLYKEIFSEEIYSVPLTNQSFLFSPTHPNPEEWYSNNNPHFQWELTPETKGVSFVLDNNAETVPGTISEGIINSKTFENIQDGIWYFHFRINDKNGWSETYHLKIRVDASPPHPFGVIIDNFGDPTNPNLNLYFETKDDTSGIGYYRFRINEEKFSELMLAQINPFSLAGLLPGKYKITVRATDLAGNNAETETIIGIEPIESPEIIIYPESYIAGEETLYLEGTSIPNVEITLILKKEGEEIKEWQVFSDNKGEWTFSTRELLKSGTYYLSAQAKDSRGAISEFSESKKIEVSFSGLVFGSVLLSFKKLILILVLIIVIGISFAGYLFCRIRQAKKIIKKETEEVKETLATVFEDLRKEIKKRVEMFDSQPGFTKKEREIYDKLKETLNSSEKSIRKEIEDVEKEL